jgi:hypothetical protein
VNVLVPIQTTASTIGSTTISTTTYENFDNSSLILTRLSSKSLDFLNILTYVLIVLVIIIIVVVINFLIWCLVTKRDQSFLVIRTNSGVNV